MAEPFKMRSGNSTPFKQMGSSPLHQDKVKTNKPNKETFIKSLGGLKDPEHVDLTRKSVGPVAETKPTVKTKTKPVVEAKPVVKTETKPVVEKKRKKTTIKKNKDGTVKKLHDEDEMVMQTDDGGRKGGPKPKENFGDKVINTIKKVVTLPSRKAQAKYTAGSKGVKSILSKKRISDKIKAHPNAKG
tara:strand:+ start:54 stop:614 length:561 start_codon:yes stop_codon:yes gene_type:complete